MVPSWNEDKSEAIANICSMYMAKKSVELGQHSMNDCITPHRDDELVKVFTGM